MTRSFSSSFLNSMRPRTASSHETISSSGCRNLIAPSSSYALPSERSRSASSRALSAVSSWKRTSPSQSMPSHTSESLIWSTASATSRLVSVFSMRRRISPPCLRAKSQLKRNVRTPPMWRKPVGLGAMRTRTDIATYRSAVPLALVSDIHGNDVALAAVVAELERLGITRVICLGDAVQGGPQPAEVLDRLAALEWPVVLGNSDDFLLRIPEDSPEPVTARQLDVRVWSLSRLGS